jgi:hypothetical protein
MESKMMHSDTDDKHLEKNLDITEVPAAAVAADGKAVPVDEHGVAHIEVDLAVQRKLLRKMDLRLLAPLWLMYFVRGLARLARTLIDCTGDRSLSWSVIRRFATVQG